MVIWPAFRMEKYRVNDHPYHAPQFTKLDCLFDPVDRVTLKVLVRSSKRLWTFLRFKRANSRNFKHASSKQLQAINWKLLATSMLVTGVGDEICWWQFQDVGVGFGHFGHQHPLSLNVGYQHPKDVTKILILSPTFLNCHQHHNVTNMTVAKTTLFVIKNIFRITKTLQKTWPWMGFGCNKQPRRAWCYRWNDKLCWKCILARSDWSTGSSCRCEWGGS